MVYYPRCNTAYRSEKPLCMGMTIFQVLSYNFATVRWKLEEQNKNKTPWRLGNTKLIPTSLQTDFR